MQVCNPEQEHDRVIPEFTHIITFALSRHLTGFDTPFYKGWRSKIIFHSGALAGDPDACFLCAPSSWWNVA
jgi:hypothetical protein